MKKLTLTREELYEMVWKEPLTSIVKRYHISYTELRALPRFEYSNPGERILVKTSVGQGGKVKLPEDYSGQGSEVVEKDLGTQTQYLSIPQDSL